MNLLKIYTLVTNPDGTTTQVPFPNEYEQAEIGEYELSGVRMGSAPSIQAKILHRLCLDDLWTEQQFVEFRGERYFVRNTPSSSKNNTDTRYSHDITFLNERFVLENVYMVDSVYKSGEDGQPVPDKRVSNNTKFVFWGDVHELVGRLNACLLSAGLGGLEDGGGFYIVVDEGVESEEKLVSFEDKFFSEAIQEVFNTFKIPYYWQGRVCHIGIAPEVIGETFKYGADNSLLSIERQNTNNGYCNRATGVGSSDNIPYYYPNEDVDSATYPHAIPVGAGGIDDDAKLVVNDYDKFKKMRPCLEQEEYADYAIQYHDGNKATDQVVVDAIYQKSFVAQKISTLDTANCGATIPLLKLSGDKAVTDKSCWTYSRFTADTKKSLSALSGSPSAHLTTILDNIKHQYPNKVSKGGAILATACKGLLDYVRNALRYYIYSSPNELDILLRCHHSGKGDYVRMPLNIGIWVGGLPQHLNHLEVDITDANGNHLSDIEHSPIVTILPDLSPEGENQWVIDLKGVKALPSNFFLHLYGKIDKYTAFIPQDKIEVFSDLSANYVYKIEDIDNLRNYGTFLQIGGKEYKTLDDLFEAYSLESITKVMVHTPKFESIPSHWTDYNDDTWYKYKQLADFGLSTSQIPEDGDKIVRLYRGGDLRMPTQDKLMPTIYRDTFGEKMFYNALNNPSASTEFAPYAEFYKDEKGNQYEFVHEFDNQNPREGKFTFEDIKPTIKGIVNADGKPMDCFVDVAFDKNDSDDIIGEHFASESEDYADELSTDSEYEHPYFFAKLPRTLVTSAAGYSFNLFNSASPDEMNISMTKGACGGCKFKIMVNEETQQNPVVIDPKTGDLMYDKEGRVVVVGTKSGAGYTYQDEQQNTAEREVWVCLLKETETYGVVMPNATSNLRPVANDSFVLLNIYLPIVYLRNAEDELSRAIIKAMYEANAEKFNFSIQFSRIYFAEHPYVMEHLSENSHIMLSYNDKLINLYVSSYSYKVQAGNVLPEITVDLSSEIQTGTAFSQNKGTDIQMPAISNGGGGVGLIRSEDDSEPSDFTAYSSKRSDMNYLSKVKDDLVAGFVEFLNGIKVDSTLSAEELAVRKKEVIGEYVRGLVGSASGVSIEADGTIYAKSLFLEESLNVPTIQFNRAMVLLGIFIIAPAAGEIEKVERTPKTDAYGHLLYQEVNENNVPIYRTPEGEITILATEGEPIATTNVTDYPLYEDSGWAEIKLEDGEYGSVEVGDMLLGFWHNIGNNSAENRDGDWNEEQQVVERNGNFALMGFSTVYFLVDAIDETDSANKRFHYTLRCATDQTWHEAIHPNEGMSFYGFGNMTNKERQSIMIMTREYSARIINKNWWTYGTDNIIEVNGKLDGFSMRARNRNGEVYTKWFTGYGRVGGNEYIFGNIDQFERVAYRLEIDQSLSGSLAPNETEDVSIRVFNGYGEDVTEDFTNISVVRTTGDSASDAVWNANHTKVGNPFQISFNDLGIDGVHKLLATFYVTATDQEHDEQASAAMDYFS